VHTLVGKAKTYPQGGAGPIQNLRGPKVQKGTTTSEFPGYLAGEVQTGQRSLGATVLVDTHDRFKEI
jgi:hypothetical protein